MRPEAEEIQVARGSVGMVLPEREQQRPLEDECSGVCRLAKAVKEAFEREAREHVLGLLALRVGERGEAASHGGRHGDPPTMVCRVSRIFFGHAYLPTPPGR